MRIALVCPYDLERPGGVQQQCLELAARLREGGDEATVVGPGRRPGTVGVGASLVVPANRSRVPLTLDPRVVRRSLISYACAKDADSEMVERAVAGDVGSLKALLAQKPEVAEHLQDLFSLDDFELRDRMVATLRRFRDDRLMKSEFGRAFVRLYYRYSPAVADYIRNRESLRAVVRTALWPLVAAIERPLAAMIVFLLGVLLIFRRRLSEP